MAITILSAYSGILTVQFLRIGTSMGEGRTKRAVHAGFWIMLLDLLVGSLMMDVNGAYWTTPRTVITPYSQSSRDWIENVPGVRSMDSHL